MPNRIVREGILTSKRISRLSCGAELLFRKLLNVTDDYGRFEGDVSIIRGRCYPLQWDSVNEQMITEWIRECSEQKLICLYTTDENTYLQVERFRQRVRSPSRYPGPQQRLTDDGHLPALDSHLPALTDSMSAGDGHMSARNIHMRADVGHEVCQTDDGHLRAKANANAYTNANAKTYSYTNAKTNSEAKSDAEHHDDFAAIPGNGRKERRISKSSSSAVTARGRLLAPPGAAPHQGMRLKNRKSSGSKNAPAAPPLAATSGGHSTAALDNIRQAIRRELGPKATKAEVERKFAEYTQPRRVP